MTAAAAEPQPWPLLPCPGGWELGAPEAPRRGEDAGPVRYVSMSEFHSIVGGNKRALYELRKRDGGVWTPDPAVAIGDIAGWLEDDIRRWGVDTGRLNTDGTKNTSRAGRPLIRRPMDSWRRVTRVYLGVNELGEAFGFKSGIGVTHLGIRERLLEADVVSGTIKGWSAERGERFARQTGRPWNLPAAIASALEAEGGG